MKLGAVTEKTNENTEATNTNAEAQQAYAESKRDCSADYCRYIHQLCSRRYEKLWKAR